MLEQVLLTYYVPIEVLNPPSKFQVDRAKIAAWNGQIQAYLKYSLSAFDISLILYNFVFVEALSTWLSFYKSYSVFSIETIIMMWMNVQIR